MKVDLRSLMNWCVTAPKTEHHCSSLRALVGFEPLEERTLLASGDLDLGFGVDGKVMTDFGADDFARSVAIQADGKIVVAGSGFAVARYRSDGTLDANFGADGKVMTDLGPDDVARSVAIQADGKIVVAGRSGSEYDYSFGLARYSSDGTLDAGFGTDGKVTTRFGDWRDHSVGNSVAIQADGKIVVAGNFELNQFESDFALARYRSDGTLDADFGADGKVITDFGGTEYADSVAIQTDGKIVVAGTSGPNILDADFALARYRSDGTLDANFGADGKVITDFGGTEYAFSVAIQTDGKIVVAGRSGPVRDPDFALARYSSDGTLDANFGADGKVMTDLGADDVARSVAIQADGKIVVVGTSLPVGGDSDFALARYNSDGTLDENFGTDGKMMTDFGAHDSGRSVAIQADGKIVVAGSSHSSDRRRDFAIARHLGDQADVQAGDADRNGEFNQLDIVLVQQAAKYLTGEPATWSEGDWNGDGLFDQLDIVAALQTGNYLKGVYPARAVDAVFSASE